MEESLPEVTLRPIATRNVARRVVLLRLGPGQEEFVAPNGISMADAYVETTWHPLAVYAGEALVGFVMYGEDTDTGQWWIIRVMIDERFQGRGYGRAAMVALIDLVRERHAPPKIYLGVTEGNEVAKRLYSSLGFQPTGEMDDVEIVMCLEC